MSLPREVLAKYIKPGDVFVETGTRWGDTCIRAAELGASGVFTCEIDPEMKSLAERHLQDAAPMFKNRVLLIVELDDSRNFLKNIKGDVVFLDAHGGSVSPVVDELAAVNKWAVKPRVILIDDMALMPGWGVTSLELVVKLTEMGYMTHFEDGARTEDILVGVRE